ncbi:hypothetical protein HLV38_01350 [Berryella wangjianweii]|uniref:Uncharacterized protein n=1 Tax=Berryella wangjianweii TaxID=2734634 RepID=A0A6M8J033_9ACTN|nr:hypothetical protein [Berryella wangjianweii]QKF06917.1 hypothetical protein HLV38_01350 [Berryella wangjianweii]
MVESFESQLDAQVEERLTAMEQPGYAFPESLGRIDWALIGAVPVVSAVLLAVGAAL